MEPFVRKTFTVPNNIKLFEENRELIGRIESGIGKLCIINSKKQLVKTITKDDFNIYKYNLEEKNILQKSENILNDINIFLKEDLLHVQLYLNAMCKKLISDNEKIFINIEKIIQKLSNPKYITYYMDINKKDMEASIKAYKILDKSNIYDLNKYNDIFCKYLKEIQEEFNFSKSIMNVLVEMHKENEERKELLINFHGVDEGTHLHEEEQEQEYRDNQLKRKRQEYKQESKRLRI